MTRNADMREFFAPLPLLAVVLMAVNDGWLKPAFHNDITGKLSDVAGCFFLPLFVSALLGLVSRRPLAWRLGAGGLFTVVLYTVLEVCGPAARLFCDLMPYVGAPVGISGPFRLTSDPTDLLTLPLVPLAIAYGLRNGGCTARAAVTA